MADVDVRGTIDFRMAGAKTFGTAFAVAIVVSCMSVGVSSADGGATIASAPVITLGQQVFGNTATHGPPFTGVESGVYDSYWML
jgi:hypothetical protein